MDAARSTPWSSSVPPLQCPWTGACSASPCIIGSDSRSALGLGSAYAASARGRSQLLPKTQGGIEQRSAHTFAEMVRAVGRKETAAASAKARPQGMIAAACILRPKFSLPSMVGLGSFCATSAPKPGSRTAQRHRIVQAHLAAVPPIGVFAVARMQRMVRHASHLHGGTNAIGIKVRCCRAIGEGCAVLLSSHC